MADPRRAAGTSASEVIARLEADSEFQARAAARRAEGEARASILHAAEAPIVAALSTVGVQVTSVWDLVNTSVPYPDALPVLIEHFETGGYPDRVMESLGRALAVRPSVAFWSRLEARYLAPRSDGEREGAAIALAACATKNQMEDLIRLLLREECGESRVFFIRPLWRWGGERGRSFVESLREHPVLGKEASARSVERR